MFDDALLEQLDALPGARRVVRLRRRRRPAATRPTTSSPPRPRAGPGRSSSTSRPRRLPARERPRVGPAAGRRAERARARRARPRCASATASIPGQVPDFIALRGDRPTGSRARRASARSRRPRCSREYGTLEAALAAGRFAPIADDLRLYRRIATMDAGAPLPDARARRRPTGSRGGCSARARAERARAADRRARVMEVISHPDFTRLHPTGGHPESQGRIEALHERFPFRECRPASEDDVLRCHTPELLERVRSAPGWLDRRHDLHRDDRSRPRSSRPGAAIEAARARRLRARTAARAPRRAGARDGLLPLRLDRRRGPLGAGRARGGARRDPRLGRAPRQRHPGDRRRRPDDLLRLASPVAVLSRERRAR